jgi:hypothetical protein
VRSLCETAHGVVLVAELGLTLVAAGLATFLESGEPRARASAELAVALFATVGLAAVVILAVRERLAYGRLRREVDERLGLRCRMVVDGATDVVMLTRVDPGSPMSAAGLRVGDRVPFSDKRLLYRRIVFGQGDRIEIPARRGEHIVLIPVAVPQLALHRDPSKLSWPEVE